MKCGGKRMSAEQQTEIIFTKCDGGIIVSADEKETPYMLFMSSVCV